MIRLVDTLYTADAVFWRKEFDGMARLLALQLSCAMAPSPTTEKALASASLYDLHSVFSGSSPLWFSCILSSWLLRLVASAFPLDELLYLGRFQPHPRIYSLFSNDRRFLTHLAAREKASLDRKPSNIMYY
jgi:hypothetical protein